MSYTIKGVNQNQDTTGLHMLGPVLISAIIQLNGFEKAGMLG